MTGRLPVAAALAGLWQRPRGSRAGLERYQATMLRRLVRHAYSHVPYYRSLFDRHGIAATRIRGLDDLGFIPTTSRATLQEAAPEQLVAEGVAIDRLNRSRSSGSSGRPLTVRRSWLEQNLLYLFRLRAERSMGVRATDRWVMVQELPHADGNDNKRIGRGLRSIGLLRRDALDIFRDPADLLASIQSLQPTVISGYASALGRVATTAEATGATIRPRLVLSGSEVLTPDLRNQISRAFGATVHDCYGSEECSLIAWQCPHSDELHTCDDAMIVEVLRNDGQPAQPGETGEIVVTNLLGYTMPFLRYRLGDIVTRGHERCPCGAPWSSLREIRGRSIDYFRLPGGRVIHPYEIVDERIKPLAPWLRQHQIVQEREDRVVLHLVPAESPPDDAIDRIECAVIELLGSDVEFEVHLVDSIPLEPSGKFRAARSLVQAPGPAPSSTRSAASSRQERATYA